MKVFLLLVISALSIVANAQSYSEISSGVICEDTIPALNNKIWTIEQRSYENIFNSGSGMSVRLMGGTANKKSIKVSGLIEIKKKVCVIISRE